MRVWELMEKLSRCPAGATVAVSVGCTLNGDADGFDADDEYVFIQSSRDPEVALPNGGAVLLSDLTDEPDDE